jgi:hypothetical protein
MQITVVLFLYAAVAAFLTAYTFYHGVVATPRVQFFTFTDHVLLTLATVAVGTVWPLFFPGLAVVVARHLCRALHLRPMPWLLHRVQ